MKTPWNTAALEGAGKRDSGSYACPKCLSTRVRAVHRRSALGRMAEWFGMKRLRCRSCYRRFYWV